MFVISTYDNSDFIAFAIYLTEANTGNSFNAAEFYLFAICMPYLFKEIFIY